MLINMLSLPSALFALSVKMCPDPYPDCFELALQFLLPGYKWRMWRNAPELLWDGHFITGISPWISWGNGSAFCARTHWRQSLTAAPTRGLALLSFHTRELMLSCNVSNLLERIIQLPGVLNSRFMCIACKFLWGIWLPSSQIYIFFQILFNNGRKGGPTKMERKCCSRKACTRIFPLAFPNKDCTEVHVEGPARLSQALTLFIAHISPTSQFNPLGNLKSCYAARKVTQNSVWSKLSVRVFICWNLPKLWELQPFTFTLREDGQKTYRAGCCWVVLAERKCQFLLLVRRESILILFSTVWNFPTQKKKKLFTESKKD